MVEYVSILQLIATLSALVVAGGIICHRLMIGWRATLGLTLLLLAISTIDIGLRVSVGLSGDYGLHRVIFLVLASITLLIAIIKWAADRDSQRSEYQFLVACYLAHISIQFVYVVPFWLFVSVDEWALQSHLIEVPAVILAALSYLTARTFFARPWSWSQLIHESIVVGVAGALFSVMLGSTGITAIGFDQMVMTTIFCAVFGLLLIVCGLVSRAMENSPADRRVLRAIRRIEKRFRVIEGGASRTLDLPGPRKITENKDL